MDRLLAIAALASAIIAILLVIAAMKQLALIANRLGRIEHRLKTGVSDDDDELATAVNDEEATVFDA